MTEIVSLVNRRGRQTARLSDEELHRAARKYLLEIDAALFGNLPGIVSQIIEHKIWESRPGGFKSFAQYALAQTSEGLNINNNQKLWLLRCSLDVTGRHIREWADILAGVEEVVRLKISTDGSRVRDRDGNSLEELGKVTDTCPTDQITYLPSGARHGDRTILRLRRDNPRSLGAIASGKTTFAGITQPRRDSDIHRDPVNRAIMYVRRMEKKDIARLIEWLREEGYIR